MTRRAYFCVNPSCSNLIPRNVGKDNTQFGCHSKESAFGSRNLAYDVVTKTYLRDPANLQRYYGYRYSTSRIHGTGACPGWLGVPLSIIAFTGAGLQAGMISFWLGMKHPKGVKKGPFL
ncbi:hypothetical protein BJ508DRAFT_372763 [Ascobolus immersus RN42]|uniref:Uncharacterized protein n=1 Tax=Ascobolus immersus RN42 TaxID=1160509 RepID=A0A3N4ILE9_ASCIM|nr:hypothetical protein BJ508DRAFT_372763 [Ascobolus immersus RN42]